MLFYYSLIIAWAVSVKVVHQAALVRDPVDLYRFVVTGKLVLRHDISTYQHNFQGPIYAMSYLRTVSTLCWRSGVEGRWGSLLE